MTQLKKYRDSISNWADNVLQGIGKRGSSFMDVDAVSHDLDTHRFLFQEFKQEHETLAPAARWTLQDLAGLDRCTVWFIRRVGADRVGFGEFGSGRVEEIITIAEYQARFRRWWNNESTYVERADYDDSDGPLTERDIRWS